MKIPSKLKIGGVVWNVKEVDALEMDVDNTTSGDTCHEIQTIRLRKNLSPEMKEQTFFHELFHAMDLQLEHNAVELLAIIFHQVLKENKLLRQ